MMNRYPASLRSGFLLVAGFLLAVPLPARAATSKAPARVEATEATSKDAERERLRGQLLDEMRTVRMWRLTEELKLDEATAAKVFPLLTRFDHRERELARQRAEASRALKRAVEEPTPDKTTINVLLDRLLAGRNGKAALDKEKAEALRKILPPVQAAKMLLLLPKLEDAFRDRIKDALRRGPPEDPLKPSRSR